MSTRFDALGFDADDTLWHNENLFQETHAHFADLLEKYHSREWVTERLFETEIRNVQHFGYGIKGFVLSMIETAVELTEGKIEGSEIGKILELGKLMLNKPLELLEGAAETIRLLSMQYPLLLITKGDLIDQEHKLERSGLSDYFSGIEILSGKSPESYRRVLKRHGIAPERFLMVGNSLRSDVLPVLEIGGSAVYIPYTVTWAHEEVSADELNGYRFERLNSITLLPDWLDRSKAGSS